MTCIPGLGQPKSIKKYRPLDSKLKKIQGLFKALHRNLRTFQVKVKFKDFLRMCEPLSYSNGRKYDRVRRLKEL